MSSYSDNVKIAHGLADQQPLTDELLTKLSSKSESAKKEVDRYSNVVLPPGKQCTIRVNYTAEPRDENGEEIVIDVDEKRGDPDGDVIKTWRFTVKDGHGQYNIVPRSDTQRNLTISYLAWPDVEDPLWEGPEFTQLENTHSRAMRVITQRKVQYPGNDHPSRPVPVHVLIERNVTLEFLFSD